MKESKLITIVVPIYNMQEYLKRCVDSIISQTYSNIEILLIDDGSTDKSKEICDEYSKIDNRIRVFHKPNGGLSDAKNYGLKKATGTYVTFVDSDDWIEPDMYKKMLFEMNKTNSDIVICGRYIDYENGNSKKWFNRDKLIMNGDESLIYLNSFYNFDMASWDKLYKKDLFRNIEFPYGKKCEDAYTTYLLFSRCNRVTYIPECYYHYYQRNGSISRGKTINMDYIYAAEEQLTFFEQKYPNIMFVAETNYVFAIKSMFQVSVERNLKLTNDFKIRKRSLGRYRKSVINNKYISCKKKITYLLFTYCTWLYRILLKIKYFGKKN